MQLRWHDTTFEVQVDALPEGRYRLRVGDWEQVVDEVQMEGQVLRFRQDNHWHILRVAVTGKGVWVAHEGRTWYLEPARATGERRRPTSSQQDGRLRAPVPAQVREIRVQPGDRVQQGQVVAILEAMKMEFRLQAPFDGVVALVDAEPGQVVEREWVVIEIRPE